MARLFPLLLFVVGLLIVVIARQRSMRPRSDRVYRPRPNPWGFPGGGPGRRASAEARTNRETHWVVRRSELDGIRDAYSSAAIDPESAIWRCGGCLAFYHRSSVDALESQNAGRCALCGSGDLHPVQVA